MQEKSGFTICGRRIILLPRNNLPSISDISVASRIITKFENFCRDKCSYTAQSCASNCDKEAIQSLHFHSKEPPVFPPIMSNISASTGVADYLNHCHNNCRSLKQRCISRLLHNGMDVGEAYDICISVQEECSEICDSSVADILSGSLEIDPHSVSTVIDLSLLRPSIPQQLYGPKKTPARRVKRAHSGRAEDLEYGLINPQLRKEKVHALNGWDRVDAGGRMRRRKRGEKEMKRRERFRYPVSEGLRFGFTAEEGGSEEDGRYIHTPRLCPYSASMRAHQEDD